MWVAVLFLTAAGEGMASALPAPAERTVEVIRNCMSRTPAPWPDSWKAEYVNAIRRGVSEVRDRRSESLGYAACLDVLAEGFEPYWQGLKKGEDRPLFELQLAQIRWYVEHLMATGVPGAEEKQKVKEQYKVLCNDAASALTSQFPFLDPKIVQKAKDDSLADCYRKIDTPLLPIFLRPLTEATIEQLKDRWEKLRYSRVDLWRQIAGNAPSVETQNLAPAFAGPGSPQRTRGSLQTRSLTAHPHYLLTQRSLDQLLSQVWAIAVSPPEYYRTAATNRANAEKRLLQARSQAYSLERRLERERSRQFLQAEQIGFLLSALIETAKSPAPQPAGKQPETIPQEDSHDVNNVVQD
jgi:hypothetical protein